MLDLGLGGALSTRVASTHGRDDLAEMKAHIRDGLYALTSVGVVVALAGSASALALPWERWLGGSLTSSTVVPASGVPDHESRKYELQSPRRAGIKGRVPRFGSLEPASCGFYSRNATRISSPAPGHSIQMKVA